MAKRRAGYSGSSGPAKHLVRCRRILAPRRRRFRRRFRRRRTMGSIRSVRNAFRPVDENYAKSLHTPFSPSLISLMIYVDVTYLVYLLTGLN